MTCIVGYLDKKLIIMFSDYIIYGIEPDTIEIK